jgi:pyruvate dehydrogenase E2 component (dihydrolipoamide acetyltransferase)
VNVKRETITVPDLGGAAEVEVIELGVAVGTAVAVDQPLVTLESDKASMEVPSPLAGTVVEVLLAIGARVKQGDSIAVIEIADDAAAAGRSSAPEPEPNPVLPPAEAPAVSAAAESPTRPERRASRVDVPAGLPGGADVEVCVPDLGGAASVEVIEISVRVGDRVEEGAALMVLEGDKASMELPCPASGVVLALEVQVGAQVSSGQRIARLRSDSAAVDAAPAPSVQAPAAARSVVPEPVPARATPSPSVGLAEGDAGLAISRLLEKEQRLGGAAQRKPAAIDTTYAGPAVRQLARELGVQLAEVQGSGPKGRLLKEDVQRWVKQRLAEPPRPSGMSGLPAVPEVDFAAFGPIETVDLNAVQKATVTSMSRSWLNVPHVTQFDHADVTDLETFRESLKAEMQARDNKLTPLPFLLMACARALKEHPRFNASLAPGGERLVLKKYVHIGIAVDTPQGLVVPVIRDVDRKTVWELAAESRELAAKARARKLKIQEMQGGCFSISSLGSIGGEGFTPIVNTPEVAILGVSKLAVRPVWDGAAFQPRKTLPLSLSYDHRVVNGADAGNFLTYLVAVLGDLRRLLL